MPKKFVGENSKAVAARARKAATKDTETAKKQADIENSYWQDDSKQMAKKQQKKEELELKKQQQLQKKAEVKALLEEELSSIKVAGKQPMSKLTRAQIQAEHEKRNLAAESAACVKKPATHLEAPLEENINRLTIEGEIATSVDEAIQVLGQGKAADDKHPEKRLKAAYTAFEEKTMPQLKIEHPTLRLSQLKQLLRKEWLKSPDNPLNQRLNSA